MSCFLIPTTIADKLERIINALWWSSKKDGRSLNWMTWDKSCVGKEDGGMNFRDLYGFNLMMLGKQCWKLLTNLDTLIGRIFKAKYFPDEDFLNAQLKHNPSFTWRSMW